MYVSSSNFWHTQNISNVPEKLTERKCQGHLGLLEPWTEQRTSEIYESVQLSQATLSTRTMGYMTTHSYVIMSFCTCVYVMSAVSVSAWIANKCFHYDNLLTSLLLITVGFALSHRAHIVIKLSLTSQSLISFNCLNDTFLTVSKAALS